MLGGVLGGDKSEDGKKSGGLLGGVLGGGEGKDGKKGGGLLGGVLGGSVLGGGKDKDGKKSGGLLGGVLGGSGGGVLGGVLGGEKGKGGLGLTSLTDGLLTGNGGLLDGVVTGEGGLVCSLLGGDGGLLGELLSQGDDSILEQLLGDCDGYDGERKPSLLSGLTDGLLDGEGGLLSGLLGGLGGGNKDGKKSGGLGLNGLTSGLLGGSGGLPLVGGLLGGAGGKKGASGDANVHADTQANAQASAKFDVNVESRPEVFVNGESAFKFYLRHMVEYENGANAGLQFDGDDKIYKIYGTGLNVKGQIKTSADWAFNGLVDASAEGKSELFATSQDGAFAAIFNLEAAATADEAFTLELVLDMGKLREAGWLRRNNTRVALVGVLRSYLKASLCDHNSAEGTVCLTDAEGTVKALLNWKNTISCSNKSYAHVAGLALSERTSSLGYTEAALSFDLSGMQDAEGLCFWDQTIRAQ